eukprot:15505877-Heterocapsa_arctica.AAC.1
MLWRVMSALRLKSLDPTFCTRPYMHIHLKLQAEKERRWKVLQQCIESGPTVSKSGQQMIHTCFKSAPPVIQK